MANIYLFYEGATAPTGWTIYNSNTGKYIRGYSSQGGTGGNASHTHTLSNWSCSTGSPTVSVYVYHGVTIESSTHTHAQGNIAVAAANNTPSYRDLKLIYNTYSSSITIPSGAIAIFDDAIPTGWTQLYSGDNRLIRINTSTGTGGSDTHTHSVNSNTTDAPSATDSQYSGTTYTIGSSTHTHTYSHTSTSSNYMPPFVDVVIASIDADGSLQDKMIALFDELPASDWESLSDSGGVFYEKFIRIASTYNATGGGSESHSHSVSGDSGEPSDTTQVTDHGTIATSNFPDYTHVHTISADLDSATGNSIPDYVNFIIAKYTAPTPGQAFMKPEKRW